MIPSLAPPPREQAVFFYVIACGRTSQAKTKAWFGVLTCFEMLDHEWSILEDVMSMANGTHELDSAAGQQEATKST